jgi:hypothetical protein
MMRIIVGAALCVAVYVAGSIGVPTDISLAAAHEVATVKSAKPADGDDCVPSRLINHPSGAIFGEEDCPDGSKHHTRLK